jgi:hypothetical protein
MVAVRYRSDVPGIRSERRDDATKPTRRARKLRTDDGGGEREPARARKRAREKIHRPVNDQQESAVNRRERARGKILIRARNVSIGISGIFEISREEN